MSIPGYNPQASLIPAVGGNITPMSGGALTDIKDVKLFSKIYKLANPESFTDDASLNANEDIKQIMITLRFNTFPFLEKKKILKAIYDSNCSNETDLALDCGCDPVRKVIADLATILLEKTAASGPLDIVKKVSSSFVEISIRIPIDKINIIMGKSSASAPTSSAPTSSAAPKPSYEQVKGENDIPKIAELKQKEKDEKDETKRTLLKLELEAERADFAAIKEAGTPEEQAKREYAQKARKEFINAQPVVASKGQSVVPVLEIPEAPIAESNSIQGNLQTMFPGQTNSGTKPIFIKTTPEEQQGAVAPSLPESEERKINFGGNQSRKLRRGN